MIKMQFSEPFMINGVLITEDVVKELNYIQNGWFGTESFGKGFNNEGFISLKEYIAELIHVILGALIAQESNSKEKEMMVDQLESLYIIRSTIERFKIPEDLEHRHES